MPKHQNCNDSAPETNGVGGGGGGGGGGGLGGLYSAIPLAAKIVSCILNDQPSHKLKFLIAIAMQA